MSQTVEFIRRLESLQEGERSRLRRLAGQPLDKTLQGFDLFTGLWWPLRRYSPIAPRRKSSWLVAKLYGSFRVPNERPDNEHDRPTLPRLLGRLEPIDEPYRGRFRGRFDALLCSPLSGLESHLCWAMRVIDNAIKDKKVSGLDWAQLLDDLSIWDRGDEHRRKRDIRDIWAEEYLNANYQNKGESHAD